MPTLQPTPYELQLSINKPPLYTTLSLIYREEGEYKRLDMIIDDPDSIKALYKEMATGRVTTDLLDLLTNMGGERGTSTQIKRVIENQSQVQMTITTGELKLPLPRHHSTYKPPKPPASSIDFLLGQSKYDDGSDDVRFIIRLITTPTPATYVDALLPTLDPSVERALARKPAPPTRYNKQRTMLREFMTTIASIVVKGFTHPNMDFKKLRAFIEWLEQRLEKLSLLDRFMEAAQHGKPATSVDIFVTATTVLYQSPAATPLRVSLHDSATVVLPRTLIPSLCLYSQRFPSRLRPARSSETDSPPLPVPRINYLPTL